MTSDEPPSELYKAAEVGTNLASLGTDCISREQAIDAFYLYPNINWTTLDVLKKINEMPTIQPEIVRCEECLYRKICSWEKQGAKFCSFAEKREVTT
jgi:hypothetical protein